jgi:hypothetical protein
MPRRHTPEPSVELSADSAFKSCDSLLRMSSFLMVQLPEDELRSIRDLLDTLTTRADHLLDAAGADVSFHFNGLAIDHDLGIGPGKSCLPRSVLLQHSYMPSRVHPPAVV